MCGRGVSPRLRCLLAGRFAVPGGRARRSASVLQATWPADPPGILPGQGQDVEDLLSLLLCLGRSGNLPPPGSCQGEDLCAPVSEQKVARCEGSHVTLHL